MNTNSSEYSQGLLEVETVVDDTADPSNTPVGAEECPVEAPPDVPARNLVVSQLPKSVDTQRLRQLFGPFGPLITALVMMDVQNGKSRGFGFVWYENVEDATRAKASMNNRVLEEATKPIKVFSSVHPDGLSESTTIIVLNFPAILGHVHARALFEKFGRVRRFQIVQDNSGRSSSGSLCATTQVLVEYEELLSSRKAVNALHGVRRLEEGAVVLNLSLPLVTKYDLPGSSRHSFRAAPTPKDNSRTQPNNSQGSLCMDSSSNTPWQPCGTPSHSTNHHSAHPLQTASLPGSQTAHPYATTPSSNVYNIGQQQPMGGNFMFFAAAGQPPFPSPPPASQQQQQPQNIFFFPQPPQPFSLMPVSPLPGMATPLFFVPNQQQVEAPQPGQHGSSPGGWVHPHPFAPSSGPLDTTKSPPY